MKDIHLLVDDTEYQAFDKVRRDLGFRTDKQTFRWMLELSVVHIQRAIKEHNKVEAAFDAGMNDYTPL